MITSNIPTNTIINRAKVELYNGSTLIANCTCSDRLSNFDIERVGESGKFFGFGIIVKDYKNTHKTLLLFIFLMNMFFLWIIPSQVNFHQNKLVYLYLQLYKNL